MKIIKINFDKILLYLSISIFFLIGISFFKEISLENKKVNELTNIQDQNNLLASKIESLDIQAKALSVYNISQGVKIYGKNDDMVLPLASLAKTMSATVILGSEELNKEVIISKDALNQIGDNGLFFSEKWNISELLKFSLMLSSNDGIFAITKNDEFFIEKMNKKAKKLGMENTIFYNTTGLDFGEDNVGAKGTANDANKMAIFAYNAHKDIFYATTMKEFTFVSLSDYKHKIQNTNVLIDKIPNLLFSKTGNTTLAGGNLTIIFVNSKGEKIAITILGSTTLGRFTDMEKIVNLML